MVYRKVPASLLMILLASTLGLSACTGSSSAPVFNPRAQKLRACPDAPHCVSSEARDEDRRVAPLAYHGNAGRAQRALVRVIRAMPRTTIVTDRPNFIHATFRSAVFGFIDDVTLRIDATHQLIQIRSASRLGYYDFGVNRRRVRRIRAAFEAVH